MIKSSAYAINEHFVLPGPKSRRRSAVYMLNNTDDILKQEVMNDLSLIIFHMSLTIHMGKFFFFNLKIKPSCQTVSKAFSRSTRQAPTQSPFIRAQLMSESRFTHLIILVINQSEVRAKHIQLLFRILYQEFGGMESPVDFCSGILY